MARNSHNSSSSGTSAAPPAPTSTQSLPLPPSRAFTVWMVGEGVPQWWIKPGPPVLVVVRRKASARHVECVRQDDGVRGIICDVRSAVNFKAGMVIAGAVCGDAVHAPLAWRYEGPLPRRLGHW